MYWAAFAEKVYKISQSDLSNDHKLEALRLWTFTERMVRPPSYTAHTETHVHTGPSEEAWHRGQ